VPKIEIVGVYPVTDPEPEVPVHLIEIWVRRTTEIVDLGKVTQKVDGKPRELWQVPYREYILTAEGDEVLVNCWDVPPPESWLPGDIRLVFFFHMLDFGRPLRTPFGPCHLPKESTLPDRLAMIRYVVPT
jgi:hypothetical protein